MFNASTQGSDIWIIVRNAERFMRDLDDNYENIFKLLADKKLNNGV